MGTLFELGVFDMNVIKGAALGVVTTTIKAAKEMFLSLLNFVLSFIFQFWPITTVAHFVRSRLPWLWRFTMKQAFIQKAISRVVAKKFGNATPGRPHAYSMAVDYATWYGFQDRTFTARHLPPDYTLNDGNLPDISDLEELCVRPTVKGDQIDDLRCNLLFASFAQWFTDSFLRTAHHLDFGPDGNPKMDDKGKSALRLPGRAMRNESNHEIDLCQIYGMNEKVTKMLRVDANADGFEARDKGCLRYQMGKDGEYPEFLLEKSPGGPGKELTLRPEFSDMHHEPLLRSIFGSAAFNEGGYDSLFAVGLEHGNATLGNSLYNVIFLRKHNWVARQISQANPTWDDEKVFQFARNTTIVLLLQVVVSDYIRTISPLDLPLGIYPGMGKGQDWYRPNRIHFEFNLLYRWHGLVPDGFPFLPDAEEPEKNFNRFRHNNGWLLNKGVAAAVHELAQVPAGRMTMGNTPRQMRMVKRDTLRLMRSANLASYNAYRERFGLDPVESFENLTGEKELSAKLAQLYGNDISRLEWYIGMLCEKHAQNMIMGDMLYYMVAHDAFTHAITNPLLADDVFREETFSPTGWAIIQETKTLADIMAKVAPPSPGQRVNFTYPGATP